MIKHIVSFVFLDSNDFDAGLILRFDALEALFNVCSNTEKRNKLTHR